MSFDFNKSNATEQSTSVATVQTTEGKLVKIEANDDDARSNTKMSHTKNQ